MNDFQYKIEKCRIIKSSPDGKFQDCWWWTKCTHWSGYGRTRIDYKYYKTHRVSAWVYELKDPEGNLFTLDSKYKVCHKCDNPICNNPKHLWVGTMLENNIDKIEKGRANMPQGESAWKSKLTRKDIIDIVECIDNKLFTQRELADIYKIDPSQISRIYNGKTWQSVTKL